MKRLLMLLVAAFGIAAGWTPASVLAAERPSILEFVPADTDLFFGYTEPVPASELWREWQRQSATGDRGTLDSARIAETHGAAAGILAALYQESLDALASRREQPLTALGLDASGITAFYTAGAQPVLRLALAEAQPFWDAVERAETQAAVSGETESTDGARLRRYPLGGDTEAELVIATVAAYAVLTVDLPTLDEADRRLALGLDTPAESLADSGRLASLAERHDTLPWATGFLDHEAIVEALTGDDREDYSRLLAALAGHRDTDPGGAIDPGCRADARAIAALWPRTVFGLRTADPETGKLAAHVGFVGTDAELLNTLARLRGQIPGTVRHGRIGGAALGLDLSELVPVLQTLMSRMAAAEWTCPELIDLQQRADPGALAQIAFVTALAGDLKGIAVAIDAANFGAETPGADAVLEIATPRPDQLWQMAAPFLPSQPAQAPMPGGPPVALPAIPGVETPLRVALRDQALLILAGSAEPNDTGADAASEGFLELRYDGAEVAALVSRWLQQSGDRMPAERREALENAAGQGAEFDADYRLTVDIDANGIRLDTILTPTDPD